MEPDNRVAINHIEEFVSKELFKLANTLPYSLKELRDRANAYRAKCHAKSYVERNERLQSALRMADEATVNLLTERSSPEEIRIAEKDRRTMRDHAKYMFVCFLVEDSRDVLDQLRIALKHEVDDYLSGQYKFYELGPRFSDIFDQITLHEKEEGQQPDVGVPFLRTLKPYGPIPKINRKSQMNRSRTAENRATRNEEGHGSFGLLRASQPRNATQSRSPISNRQTNVREESRGTVGLLRKSQSPVHNRHSNVREASHGPVGLPRQSQYPFATPSRLPANSRQTNVRERQSPQTPGDRRLATPPHPGEPVHRPPPLRDSRKPQPRSPPKPDTAQQTAANEKRSTAAQDVGTLEDPSDLSYGPFADRECPEIDEISYTVKTSDSEPESASVSGTTSSSTSSVDTIAENVADSERDQSASSRQSAPSPARSFFDILDQSQNASRDKSPSSNASHQSRKSASTKGQRGKDQRYFLQNGLVIEVRRTGASYDENQTDPGEEQTSEASLDNARQPQITLELPSRCGRRCVNHRSGSRQIVSDVVRMQRRAFYMGWNRAYDLAMSGGSKPDRVD